MKLLTCTGCKFSGDCDHARHLRASFKGYGVRSMKFACAKREDVFSPGQPVLFTTYMSLGDEYNNSVEVTFPGYAIEQIKGRVFGFIHRDTQDTTGNYAFEPMKGGYVKIPLRRVAADDARPVGDVRVCDWCGNHPGIGAPCNIDPQYTPREKCLANTVNMERAMA